MSKKRKKKKKKIFKTDSGPSPKTMNKEEIQFTGISFNIKLLQKDDEKEEDDKFIHIQQLLNRGRDFTTILQMLWQYINSIGILAETTSSTSIATLLILLEEIKYVAKNRSGNPLAELKIELLGKNDSIIQLNKNQKIYIYDPNHLKKIFEFKQHNEAALEILHDTAIQQLINAWEKFISDILYWFYSYNTDKITKDKSLSYSQILQFNNLDELKQTVIDLEIKSFLQKTLDEQIKTIDNIFKINFNSLFQEISLLNELMLTRHLIVHYGGVITNEYLNKRKKLKEKLLEVDKSDLGKKLHLTPSYIRTAWRLVYTAGVVLVHHIAKRTYHSTPVYDEFLNEAAYNSIKSNQLTSAIKLLEYALSQQIKNSTLRWYLTLNLAQAYKWNNNIEKYKEVIEKEDWDAANVLFQLCVAALNENFDEFPSLLKEAANKKKINITELYEWPIFRAVRLHKEFERWIEEAFGYKLNKHRELLEHRVIDHRPDITIKKLSDFFGIKLKGK